MSSDDVHPSEMNSPHDFDDAASEALLSGTGREVDPEVAQAVADMRTAFTSQPPVVGAELSALMAGSSATSPSVARRRFERMRSSMIAKIAAGAAAAMAATGGLAVAGALPAPVQHAFSDVGIGSDSPHHSTPPNSVGSSTGTETDVTETTLPGDDNGGETSTSIDGNHGSDVSGVAHDGDQGCEHGAEVSAVASDGRSHNDGSQCETSTTVPGEPTPTTIDEGHGHNGDDGNDQGDNGDNNQGDHGHGGGDQGDNGDGHDSPPTTSVGTSPTTIPHYSGGDQGGGHQGGNNN
jgi:hypothetical protein